MKRISVFACAILSLGLAAWAGGKSYTVAIYDPAMAGSTALKPGDYQLSVENDKATLHRGKVSAENSVKVETADEKYATTTVRYLKADGKLRIQEIHLGGTKTKVVFVEAQP